MLHDLGLTARYAGTDRFEVAGADAADRFLASHNVSDDRRAIVWDAIALHTSVGIAVRKRPEIALVHIGAGIDVLGIGLDDLPKHAINRTIEALSRCNFKNAFVQVLLGVIAANPASTAMTWMSEVGRGHVHGYDCPNFIDTLRSASFDE